MIIRRRAGSVKYTHDAEAMVEAIVALREFAGVSRDEAAGWLKEDAAFSWSARYFHNTVTGDFIAADWTPGRLLPPETVELQLWKADEYIQELVHKRGFSCLICGSRTPFDRRGKMYDITIEASIWRRQTIFAPTLICIPCAIEIPALTSWWLPDRKRAATADALIRRVVAAK